MACTCLHLFVGPGRWPVPVAWGVSGGVAFAVLVSGVKACKRGARLNMKRAKLSIEGLPDPVAARKTLIALMAFTVGGARVRYRANTQEQAYHAFELATGIAAKARASFWVLLKILEVRHPSGGAVLCQWKDTKDSGAVLE
jgi:hypothetical protein